MSVMSAWVVGVWVCVGSSTTWCHSVCVFCDPVVTLILFHLKTLIHCGAISMGVMGRIKMFNHRLIFVTVFVAVSVVSGWSPVPVRADPEDFGGRYAFVLGAGYHEGESISGINFMLDNNGFSCSPGDEVSPPHKSLSECLADNSLTLSIRNNLGPCDAVVLIPCIEGVFARNANLEWISGVYSDQRDTPESGFDAIPIYETGRERYNSHYMFPGLGSNPDQLYRINALMLRSVVRGKLLYPAALDVSIRAINQISRSGHKSSEIDYSSGLEMAEWLNDCNANLFWRPDCLAYGTNPLTNQFKLVLRLPALPYGWLQGRMFMPDVAFQSVKGATSQPYRVTLTGSPIPTPRITRVYFSDIPSERAQCSLLSNFLKKTTSLSSCFHRWDPSSTSGSHSIFQNGIENFNDVVKADPEFDSATKIVDDWKVTMNFDETGARSHSPCEKQGAFNGFVSSNALVFSNYPTFDKALESLDYVVGGPHFMPDKSVFSGLYSMIITKDYAKCLWGLSKPDFNASLQVIDQDGVASNAVTVLGTDERYVRFSATGFTFSQKTLKVKLFKSLKELNASKKKITCVKGETVRTITGAKSICPKGFKKKK